MNTLGSIDLWTSQVEQEIDELTVSKHSSHLIQIERIIKGQRSKYLNYRCWLVINLILVYLVDLFLVDCLVEWQGCCFQNHIELVP